MESEQATPVYSIKDVVQSSMKVLKFNKYLRKTRGHIGQNVVEIAIKIKTIVQKPLMIKIIKFRLKKFRQLIYIIACVHVCVYIYIYIYVCVCVCDRLVGFIHLISKSVLLFTSNNIDLSKKC